jgi:hypothetical protein
MSIMTPHHLPLNMPLSNLKPESYTALAINPVLPRNQYQQATAPQQIRSVPKQVSILKTTTNAPKPAGVKNNKPFKLPSLALVALEVAGLGLIGFVGNYMGRLAYCETTKQAVSGGIKTFDSITSQHQSLKKALQSIERGHRYPTHIDGSWQGHANLIVSLVKDYSKNPKSFTGIKLTNLKPEQIRQELYQYIKTALEFYQRTGNVEQQLEVAQLLYDHKLSIPLDAYKDVDIALKAFKQAHCKPLALWDVKVVNNPRFKPFNYREWEVKLTKQMKEHPELASNTVTDKNPESYRNQMLRLLNTHTAMMESLNIIQNIQSSSQGYRAPKQMEVFWANNLQDIKPVQQQNDLIEITLSLKALHLILAQYGEQEKTWEIEKTLQNLSVLSPSKSTTESLTRQMYDACEPLNDFLKADLAMTDGFRESSLPMVLHKWSSNQIGQLATPHPESKELLTELLACVQAPLANQAHEPMDNNQRLLNFYSTLKESQGTSLFTLKLWIKLLSPKIELLGNSPTLRGFKNIQKAVGKGSYPQELLRYDPVETFHTIIADCLPELKEALCTEKSPTT